MKTHQISDFLPLIKAAKRFFGGSALIVAALVGYGVMIDEEGVVSRLAKEREASACLAGSAQYPDQVGCRSAFSPESEQRRVN